MTEKEFATKEETDKHIETLEIFSLGYCPVIGDSCRIDCVCYYGHTPRRQTRYDSEKRKQTHYFTVTQPYCDYVLISGHIYMLQ